MNTMSHNSIGSTVFWRDYQKQEDVKKIFPKEESLYWFIRVNKEDLIEGGAIVLWRQKMHIVPSKFERIAFDIASKAAKRLIED